METDDFEEFEECEYQLIGKSVAVTFDIIDDNVIAEICMWMILKDIASLIRFAKVNKRINNVVYHSSYSHLIWRDIDILKLPNIGLPYRNRELIEMQRDTTAINRWPGMQYITNVTLNDCRNIDDFQAIVETIPNMNLLSMKILPKHEFDGTTNDLFPVLAQMKHLTKLGLIVINQFLMPKAQFGPLVETLVIKEDGSTIDWSGCSFNSVKRLIVCGISKFDTIAWACPNVKKLMILDPRSPVHDFAAAKIFTELESINFKAINYDLEFPKLVTLVNSLGCNHQIRELTIHSDIKSNPHLVSIDSLIAHLPNLTKLHMSSASPADIRSLSKLKYLEDLSITMYSSDEAQDYVAAFTEFGHSGGATLKSLHMCDFTLCDLRDFYRSRKCSKLQHLILKSCELPIDSLSILASIVASTLIHIDITPVIKMNRQVEIDIIRDINILCLFSKTKAFVHVALLQHDKIDDLIMKYPCAIYRNFDSRMFTKLLYMRFSTINIIEFTIALHESIFDSLFNVDFITIFPKLTKMDIISLNAKNITHHHVAK